MEPGDNIAIITNSHTELSVTDIVGRCINPNITPHRDKKVMYMLFNMFIVLLTFTSEMPRKSLTVNLEKVIQ